MKNILQQINIRHKSVIILFLIVILGAGFRFYGWSDLIFFEIDQARDYKLLDELSEEGIGSFPLLGPKAGGTFFRLGPVYYVPTYLLTKVLGLSPYLIVLPEIIFSVLTILLLFVFLKEFFRERIALYCTALFASSLFFVEYAHFAWNPNYIPFFFLLFLYAMLRYVRSDTQKMWWAIILACSAGIVMQLHTITFVATPMIVLAYFVFLRKALVVKHVIVFVVIFVLFSAPLVANDILTKGENIQEFFVAKEKREGKSEGSSLGKVIFINAYNHVKYYTVITTSQHVVDDLARVRSSDDLFDLAQNNLYSMRAKVNFGSIAFLCVFLGLFFIFLVRELFDLKKNKEKDYNIQKYHFVLLIVLTQIIFSLLFVPLALNVDSRHFLPLFFVPFVIIGFLFVHIEEKIAQGRKIVVVIFMILFLCNILGTVRWLYMIDHYEVGWNHSGEFILESYFIITMEQWRSATDTIAKISENHDGPLHVQSSTYHIRSLIALLQGEYGKEVYAIEPDQCDQNGMYFVLKETTDIHEGVPLTSEIGERFDVIDTYDLGTVQLFQLQIKDHIRDSCTNGYVQDGEEGLSIPCYDLRHDVSQRDRCRIRDIKHFFEN